MEWMQYSDSHKFPLYSVLYAVCSIYSTCIHDAYDCTFLLLLLKFIIVVNWKVLLKFKLSQACLTCVIVKNNVAGEENINPLLLLRHTTVFTDIEN